MTESWQARLKVGYGIVGANIVYVWKILLYPPVCFANLRLSQDALNGRAVSVYRRLTELRQHHIIYTRCT